MVAIFAANLRACTGPTRSSLVLVKMKGTGSGMSLFRLL